MNFARYKINNKKNHRFKIQKLIKEQNKFRAGYLERKHTKFEIDLINIFKNNQA